jgi:hypothetical protein
LVETGVSVPKSLDTGVSAIVPIRTPATEKEALQAVLCDGETISGLTRELWKKEVKKRTKKKTKTVG